MGTTLARESVFITSSFDASRAPLPFKGSVAATAATGGATAALLTTLSSLRFLPLANFDRAMIGYSLADISFLTSKTAISVHSSGPFATL
jgi:hypothetical protein